MYGTTRRAGVCAVIAAMLLLQACGGGGSDAPPGTDDTAASTEISRSAVYPVSHIYTTAGMYTLSVSGTYAVTNFVGPDSLRVFFSFSGQGAVTGESDPVYAIAANGQSVTISQTVTVNATGAGPWQMAVLCFTGTSTGTMTSLDLHSVQN